MRETILWIHRWLGLTAGVVFAIAAGTGAVLVYQPQLDVLLGGPRFEATEGAQPVSAIEAAVREAHPSATLTGIYWPEAGAENVVRVALRENGRATNLWVDNGSARIVEPRRQLLVLLAIRRLHVNLFMGPVGRLLVVWTSAAALVALTLGVILWWPGIRKLWTGFRIRMRRGAYILNFDAHQALGIVAVPLLAFGSATGVLMMYGGVTDRIEHAVHGPRPEPATAELRSVAPPEPGMVNPGIGGFADAARAAVPGARLTVLTLPAEPDGVVEAELRSEDGATVRVILDRYSGAALDVRAEVPRFRFDRRTNEQLHVANVGGPVLKVLYMLSCIIGFVLLPTGVAVWWMKRTRKAGSAERRAAGTATSAP